VIFSFFLFFTIQRIIIFTYDDKDIIIYYVQSKIFFKIVFLALGKPQTLGILLLVCWCVLLLLLLSNPSWLGEEEGITRPLYKLCAFGGRLYIYMKSRKKGGKKPQNKGEKKGGIEGANIA